MPLTLQDIHTTARAAFNALANGQHEACLVGSAACHEYGNSRIPNDVDILVLTDTITAEEIKASIMLYDPRFCLARSTSNPNAAYTVLWYTLSSPPEPLRACRVDIFVPGVVQIPSFPTNRIVRSPTNNLPVMPFPAVLIHKILAWVAHGKSSKPHVQSKQIADVSDAKELLSLATAHASSPLTEAWLPPWFLEDAAHAIRAFTSTFPDTRDQWIRLGFHIPE